MQKLKILHIISQRPDSTGSGFYLQSIINESIAAGHENFLVAGIPAGYESKVTILPANNCKFVTSLAT